MPTTPPPLPLSECGDGIEGYLNLLACCPIACGQCGGTNCDLLPGGASNCCPDIILSGAESCSDVRVAPCVFGSGMACMHLYLILGGRKSCASSPGRRKAAEGRGLVSFDVDDAAGRPTCQPAFFFVALPGTRLALSRSCRVTCPLDPPPPRTRPPPTASPAASLGLNHLSLLDVLLWFLGWTNKKKIDRPAARIVEDVIGATADASAASSIRWISGRGGGGGVGSRTGGGVVVLAVAGLALARLAFHN